MEGARDKLKETGKVGFGAFLDPIADFPRCLKAARARKLPKGMENEEQQRARLEICEKHPQKTQEQEKRFDDSLRDFRP